MAWIEPGFTRGEVNRAGGALIESKDLAERTQARVILADWRSAHGWPLHALAMTLRNRANKVARQTRPLIAQRLKRLVSIENKLLRRPHVRTTQMQDIGGCRAVMSTMTEVRRLQHLYDPAQDRSRVFTRHRIDDYIERPKLDTGYRSLHLVYRYESAQKPEWRNMRCEVQIRSRLQHAWATAVEAVSFFTNQDLKAGEGDPDWLRFFQLMAHSIALEEGCPGIQDIPELGWRVELREYWHRLNVALVLGGWAMSLQRIEDERTPDSRMWLLHLNTSKRTIAMTAFAKSEEQAAATHTERLELEFAEDPAHHIVLVAVESVQQLIRAYPGFFADTEIFRRAAIRAISSAD